MSRRIAVYGGSFNPFGRHHQDIIRWIIEHAGFNNVLVVPSAAHALKHDLLPFHHRYNMARLGVQDLVVNGLPSLSRESSVQVLTVEMDMLREQAAPIYTYDLLRTIQRGWGQDLGQGAAEIRFAIGPDIRAEFPQWHHVAEIEREFGFIDIPIQAIRASHVRNMIRQGLESWRRHVPPQVAWYVGTHRLYRDQDGRPG